MTGTTKKFNKAEATLVLLSACMGIGLGVGMRYVKINADTISASTTVQPASLSQTSSFSPQVNVYRQSVYRPVARTRGS
ncbi:MAG: hypothetical protein KC422_00325 [Trueperaceae bacterium]|nr:hypothetical protein [Trueperaceae bacterium]